VLTLTVEGKATRIDRETFVIGRRARDAHLVLRDPGVSRQHAIIERRGIAYVLTDMASANGVIVNGERIARKVLRPGDVVEIGPFVIAVEQSSG
jgi:pSer/pThr/pTyr-binding forkhead associated (FHA) protein